ncbi:hypothetical protein OK016_12935 [Vibrio chagasii]|nr:hypothetical protein [Vibrio chagasii]
MIRASWPEVKVVDKLDPVDPGTDPAATAGVRPRLATPVTK